MRGPRGGEGAGDTGHFPQGFPRDIGALAERWLWEVGSAGGGGVGGTGCCGFEMNHEPNEMHNIVESRINILNCFLLTHKFTHKFFSFHTNTLYTQTTAPNSTFGQLNYDTMRILSEMNRYLIWFEPRLGYPTKAASQVPSSPCRE